MNYESALEYIHAVQWAGHKPGLTRTRTLLAALGDPHKQLRFVHIAGTNGNFGLEDGDYIGLPTAEASWHFDTFTVEDYEALKARISSGEIVVDNSSDDGVKPTVSEYTEVNYIQ